MEWQKICKMKIVENHIIKKCSEYFFGHSCGEASGGSMLLVDYNVITIFMYI